VIISLETDRLDFVKQK